jgi:hypothetical protein
MVGVLATPEPAAAGQILVTIRPFLREKLP